MARILVVDDEPSLRRILAVLLQGDGHVVYEAAGVTAATAAVASKPLDLVITDQKMKDGEGTQVIGICRENDSALPVIMLTAHATVELAVEAMRLGAFDFITKPFNPEQVRAVVARACERTNLRRENILLKGQVQRLGPVGNLIGQSLPMQEMREAIARVAPTNATVLITGETGTGKELAARAVHAASRRADKPFMAINCAALSETLLDSELFGHERGAFTGAEGSRIGLFEAADGGTLFLDEAGEMPMVLQAKILRVLAENQIMRVGSRTSRPVDVRLILATHRDLKQRVIEGHFREDLYYRIAVIPISMPPLRDRMEDLAELVHPFLIRASQEMNLPARTINQSALEKLRTYSFPGNVRELRNLIERACILAKGEEILPGDFPLDTTSLPSHGPEPMKRFVDALPGVVDVRQQLDDLDRLLVVRALTAANGVQAEAARRLGLTRSDMTYRLRKYGIGVESLQQTSAIAS